MEECRPEPAVCPIPAQLCWSNAPVPDMLAPASRRHPFTPTRTPLFGRRPALPRPPPERREGEALGHPIGWADLSLTVKDLARPPPPPPRPLACSCTQRNLSKYCLTCVMMNKPKKMAWTRISSRKVKGEHSTSLTTSHSHRNSHYKLKLFFTLPNNVGFVQLDRESCCSTFASQCVFMLQTLRAEGWSCLF